MQHSKIPKWFHEEGVEDRKSEDILSTKRFPVVKAQWTGVTGIYEDI